MQADSVGFLRGVNFTGLSHQRGSQAPSRAAVGYYVHQKKMNLVRLNISWEFIQSTPLQPLDAANAAIVDDQVDRITAAGACVILDMHNYGRREWAGQDRIIGEGEITAEMFADLWRRVALRWSANPRVIFGLMNEPHDQDPEDLVRVNNAAIRAIRLAGARNLVMVACDGWNSLGFMGSAKSRAAMLKVIDPKKNWCLDVHHYFDEYSRGQGPNVRRDPIASLIDFTRWAREHGLRAFCGEFGCGVNTQGIEACRQLLRHIEGNRDVYLGWAWWGGGGPWQPDYLFLLDPFASETSPTNPDPEGSRTWASPVDRPQMKLLQEFLPSSASAFNGWLIESALPRGKLNALLRCGDRVESGSPWRSLGWRERSTRWYDTASAGTAVDCPAGTLELDGGLICPGTSLPFALRSTGGSAGRAIYRRDASSGPRSLVDMVVDGRAVSHGPGGPGAGGRLFDLAIYSPSASPDDIARVEGRLAWDAGIAHWLPYGHAFRQRPPAVS